MSNLYTILTKLRALEENTETTVNAAPREPDSDVHESDAALPMAQGGAGASDESVEECPQDGGGNIQLSMGDLMKLIQHLQGGKPEMDHDQALLGDEEVGEEFANAQDGAPDQEIAPVAAVMPTGDDLASKGIERPKVNGGGNPMQEHLAELYAQIKEAAKYSDIPAAQRKAKNPQDWKVSMKGLDAEGKEGKISHKDNLAKNSATLKEANQMVRKLRK